MVSEEQRKTWRQAAFDDYKKVVLTMPTHTLRHDLLCNIGLELKEIISNELDRRTELGKE